MQLEREAVARYTEHPADSSDPRLVAYWESLRRNESEHRDLLEEWLHERGAAAGEECGTAVEESATAVARGPEASAIGGPGEAVTGRARDLAALRADHAFEEAAVKRYGQMAAEAGDSGLAELFRELARDEAGHRRGLRRMIAVVEDPATPVILFCPLCGWEIDFGPAPAEGTEGKCPMCPGRFALRLDAGGDWILERLAP